jgi:hypothetical protein
MVIILKCIYCKSDAVQYLKLKNGAYYPEIIHKDICPLLKKHISGENGNDSTLKEITSFKVPKLSSHNCKIGHIIRGHEKRAIYNVPKKV